MKTLLHATAAVTALAVPAHTVPTFAASGDEALMLPESKLEVMDPLIDTLDELEGRAILVEFFAHR